MNISACIITNNNPKVIEAIKSVKNCCNEIILVETSGRNDFQNELNNLGVKLYWYKWNNDFSAARNFSISHATGDYILIIDSDEILKTEIKYLDEQFDYFFAKIFNNSMYHYSARLFKNNIGLQYYNKIHENLNYAGFKGALSDIELMHDGYISESEIMIKQKRNLEYLETDLNNPGRNYYYLCAYYYFKDNEKAIEYGVKCLEDTIGNEIKANACLMLYEIYNLQNDIKAFEYLRKSVEYLPEQSRARIYLIDNLYKAGL